MNLRAIGALISKDFSLFFKNRFFALMTALGIVFYLAIYFLMPSSVDETLVIGLYAPVMPPAFELTEEEGLEFQMAESEAALKEAVIEGEYLAGIALPADIMDRFASGQKPRVNVYFASSVPEELKDGVVVLIEELAYQETGLGFEASEPEILGPDMMGMQIPPRDRMRPLFAIFIMLFEIFGLAVLISEEVERRTIQALLVTPMTLKDLFAAKGAVGMTLAFGQAVLFMGIVGGMSQQPLIILATLLLGGVLVTGVGFLLAALGKDMMSVMGWFVIALVILVIPSFGVVFPGTVSGWAKVIPSYYLVDTVHRVSNFGAGWGDIGYNLLILLGFAVALVWIGIIALRRKLQ